MAVPVFNTIKLFNKHPVKFTFVMKYQNDIQRKIKIQNSDILKNSDSSIVIDAI